MKCVIHDKFILTDAIEDEDVTFLQNCSVYLHKTSDQKYEVIEQKITVGLTCMMTILDIFDWNGTSIIEISYFNNGFHVQRKTK